MSFRRGQRRDGSRYTFPISGRGPTDRYEGKPLEMQRILAREPDDMWGLKSQKEEVERELEEERRLEEEGTREYLETLDNITEEGVRRALESRGREEEVV